MKEFIVQAAILIATHQVIPFDLAVIHTRDDQRLFSFLCVEWGIIADVDCESEKYRFLGRRGRKTPSPTHQSPLLLLTCRRNAIYSGSRQTNPL